MRLLPKVILAWLLIGPRLEIIPIASSSLRVEDFFLLAAGAWTLLHRDVALRSKRLRQIFGALIAFTLTGILSTVIGVMAGRVDLWVSLAYAIRPLEYALILPVAVYVASENPRFVAKLLGVAIAINVFIAIGQSMFGLQVSFSKFSLDRGAGLMAGPYELAAVLVAMLFYFHYKNKLVLATLSLMGLILSQSRSAVLSLLLILLYLLSLRLSGSAVGRFRKAPSGDRGLSAHQTPVRLLVSLAATSVGLFLALTAPDLYSGLQVRLATTSVVEEFYQARLWAEQAPLVLTSSDFLETGFGRSTYPLVRSSETDVSAATRFYRWLLLMKSWSQQASWVQGLGPGFGGVVDGSFVKFTFENGIFGLFLFLSSVRALLARTQFWFKLALASYLINGIFIDILVAMRPMMFLYLLWALSRSEQIEAETGKASPLVRGSTRFRTYLYRP